MEFYEMIAYAGTGAEPEPDFDVEEWAARKKEEREQLYADVDAMAEIALTDPRILEAYLEKQGIVPFGVSNTLLILKQRPAATHVHEAGDWGSLGRGIQRGQGGNAIRLFKADHEYARDDGRMATGFNVARYFDVSQTYGKPVPKRRQLEIKPLLSALTKSVPVSIQLSDTLPQEAGAQYNRDTKQLFVAKGLEGGFLFRHIARELAGGFLEEGESFQAVCSANIVCKRYGVAPATIEGVPQEIRGMDAKDKRGVLEHVRHVAAGMIGRMEQNLEPYRQILREQARQNPSRQSQAREIIPSEPRR